MLINTIEHKEMRHGRRDSNIKHLKYIINVAESK